MGRPDVNRWLSVALLIGSVYLVAGVVLGALAGGAATHQMVVTWRLAAWVVSMVAFLVHLWYEQSRVHSSPRVTAFHVTVAVALGASGLAAAALLRALVTGTGKPVLLAISLVVWPLMAGIPAFLVALVIATVLARRHQRA